MQKWRMFYILNPRRLQIKVLNDETGITLVELLASLSILSIVILLAGSVHLFGQRQFIEQTESASQTNDISSAMTMITADLRKKQPQEKVKITDSRLEIGENLSYTVSNQQLLKENTVLADDVNVSFESVNNQTGVKVTIKSTKVTGPAKLYESTIYFRR